MIFDSFTATGAFTAIVVALAVLFLIKRRRPEPGKD
jgi:hypothetical protein